MQVWHHLLYSLSHFLFKKVNGLLGPPRNFIISRVLAGAQKQGTVSEIRLPVTLPILARLISVQPHVLTLHYVSCYLPDGSGLQDLFACMWKSPDSAT